MRKKELYDRVIAYFEQAMPVAETELHYEDPFQLLVAVILSAQCTDKRVNMITPALFRDFPTAEAMAATTPDVVYEYIRSVSYPNNKAKHLVGMAQMLVRDYGGQVPDTLEELVKLPGVGRKTANVIQSVVFHKAAMAVDTHVFRVSHRIGLVPGTCTTPLATEKHLTRYIPEALIPKAVRVYGTQSEMRQMRIERHLPGIAESKDLIEIFTTEAFGHGFVHFLHVTHLLHLMAYTRVRR